MTRSGNDTTQRDGALATLDRISGRAINLSARRLDAMSLSDEETEDFDRGARTALQLLRLAKAASDARAQHIKDNSAHEDSADEESLSEDRLRDLVREYNTKLDRLDVQETQENSDEGVERNCLGRRGL